MISAPASSTAWTRPYGGSAPICAWPVCHRGDERGVVARDDALDRDAQLLGQVVDERLDVLDEGVGLAGRARSR